MLRVLRVSPRFVVTACAVVAGLSVGGWLGSLPASACTCATPYWAYPLQLQSVTASDPSVDHGDFWPAEASLNVFASRQYFVFWTDDADGVGVLSGSMDQP